MVVNGGDVNLQRLLLYSIGFLANFSQLVRDLLILYMMRKRTLS